MYTEDTERKKPHESFTSQSSVLTCIRLQCSSHSVHTNVASDSYMITSVHNQYIVLVVLDRKGLDRNIV